MMSHINDVVEYTVDEQSVQNRGERVIAARARLRAMQIDEEIVQHSTREQNAHNQRIKAASIRLSLRRLGYFYDNTAHRTLRDINGDDEMIKVKWSQYLSILLAGTRDYQSPLHLLRGYEDIIIRKIYSILYSGWINSITLTPPAHSVGRLQAINESIGDDDQDYAPGAKVGSKLKVRSVLWLDRRQHEELGQSRYDHPQIAFSICGIGIEFPKSQNININMMPFIMGDVLSLPEYVRQYQNLIMSCPIEYSMIGQVCYLTVSEGYVSKKATQRRNGLHVEAFYQFHKESSMKVALEHRLWVQDLGPKAIGPDELIGGLYMASNIDTTTAVYNALLTDISEMNQQGGIEHLRTFIGEPYHCNAGELIWCTDRTPHEALPQVESGIRQFFRLVTSDISVWFEDHSTYNPNVALPQTVTIVKGSKFI